MVIIAIAYHHFLWRTNCPSSSADSSLGCSIAVLLAARHCGSNFLPQKKKLFCCDAPLLVDLQMTAAYTEEAQHVSEVCCHNCFVVLMGNSLCGLCKCWVGSWFAGLLYQRASRNVIIWMILVTQKGFFPNKETHRHSRHPIEMGRRMFLLLQSRIAGYPRLAARVPKAGIKTSSFPQTYIQGNWRPGICLITLITKWKVCKHVTALGL